MKAAKHNTGRLRRFSKWAGLVATIVLSAVWIGSGWYSMGCSNSRVTTVVASYGALGIMWGGPPVAPDYESAWLWTFRPIAANPARFNWKPFHRSNETDGSHFLFIPLWTIVVVSSVITVFARRRDLLVSRMLKYGTCSRCAFSLSGLAPDAVCPECGKAR